MLGCDGEVVDGEPGDGPSDSFLMAGKADGGGLEEGTPDALGLLAFVNAASFDSLNSSVSRGGVGLERRAASNIVAYRAGGDGALGTDDDERFDTLAELDAIPYVGPVALEKLLAAYRRTLGPDQPSARARIRMGTTVVADGFTKVPIFVDLTDTSIVTHRLRLTSSRALAASRPMDSLKYWHTWRDVSDDNPYLDDPRYASVAEHPRDGDWILGVRAIDWLTPCSATAPDCLGEVTLTLTDYEDGQVLATTTLVLIEGQERPNVYPCELSPGGGNVLSARGLNTTRWAAHNGSMTYFARLFGDEDHAWSAFENGLSFDGVRYRRKITIMGPDVWFALEIPADGFEEDAFPGYYPNGVPDGEDLYFAETSNSFRLGSAKQLYVAELEVGEAKRTSEYTYSREIKRISIGWTGTHYDGGGNPHPTHGCLLYDARYIKHY